MIKFRFINDNIIFITIIINIEIGGGENGDSFKLENEDSAHIEICRVGSFNISWGGVPLNYLKKILSDGTILIPVSTVTYDRFIFAFIFLFKAFFYL